jgi:hypothetical protein
MLCSWHRAYLQILDIPQYGRAFAVNSRRYIHSTASRHAAKKRIQMEDYSCDLIRCAIFGIRIKLQLIISASRNFSIIAHIGAYAISLLYSPAQQDRFQTMESQRSQTGSCKLLACEYKLSFVFPPRLLEVHSSFRSLVASTHDGYS